MTPSQRLKSDVSTGDMPLHQPPPISAQNTIELADEFTGIEAVQGFTSNKYLEDVAFAEQGVTIRLERPAEKNAPRHIPVWVNGKGAEVLVKGQWQTVTYLPIGQPITLKRKYVEVLARAKPESVSTRVVTPMDEDPQNHLDRSVHAKYPFSVIHDPAPNGVDWLSRILMEG